MKIGVLTSSRADYGIYLPLLKLLKEDNYFKLEIIAFGTHLSKFQGHTIDDILKFNFGKVHAISVLLSNDNEEAISTSYGITVLKFSGFWAQNTYDLVLCLGDRFEMSAAVQAAIPFGVKFAHFYGGETTLGAIDNIYRHQITLASSLYFTATQKYTDKITDLIGTNDNVYTVGSLSLDNIEKFVPLERTVFFGKFKIEQAPYALVTFHPETVSVLKNKGYAQEMLKALAGITNFLNVVVTMPNADTLGALFRESLYELKSKYSQKVILIENFGKENYFSAMYYSKLLLGNTSSGIIEAASFKKYVLNVGDRQKGRLQSENTVDIPFDANQIISQTKKYSETGDYLGKNKYYKVEVSKTVIHKLKIYNDD